MTMTMTDLDRTVSIEPQAGTLDCSWSDPIAHELLGALTKWRAATAMSRIRIDLQSSGDYLYRLDHEDGRKWSQGIRLGADVRSTALTFSVSDFWTLDELAGKRSEVLRLFIAFLLRHPTQKVRVTWI